MNSSATETDIKRLGIIAGSGNLPLRLIRACEERGIEVFIVAFAGQTDPAILKGRNHVITRIEKFGHIVRSLRDHDIRDIVTIGGVRRPSLAELRPDWAAMKIVMRHALMSKGDDGALRALRREYERAGFVFHGIHKFVSELLAEPGPVGARMPSPEDMIAIARGVTAARAIGRLDIGQAVVVQQGIVLGLEGVEGTDELIRRCAAYKRKGRGPILVKLCKPQQDMDLDLPTIGPDTVHLCAHAGMAGIAVEAGRSLILDPQDVAEIADKYGLFVTGLGPDEADHDA